MISKLNNGQMNRDATAAFCRFRWLGYMLLLPFLLFSTIAQGTMLESGADDGVTFVICSGEGAVEMVMGDDGTLSPVTDHGSKDHTTNSACDWALHSQAASDVATAPSVAPVLQVIATVYVMDIPLHIRRAEVLTPAARGPPTLI